MKIEIRRYIPESKDASQSILANMKILHHNRKISFSSEMPYCGKPSRNEVLIDNNEVYWLIDLKNGLIFNENVLKSCIIRWLGKKNYEKYINTWQLRSLMVKHRWDLYDFAQDKQTFRNFFIMEYML